MASIFEVEPGREHKPGWYFLLWGHGGPDGPHDTRSDAEAALRSKAAELEDGLLDDATHAAADKFEAAGIRLTTEELHRVNDLLTEILAGRVPRGGHC